VPGAHDLLLEDGEGGHLCGQLDVTEGRPPFFALAAFGAHKPLEADFLFLFLFVWHKAVNKPHLSLDLASEEDFMGIDHLPKNNIEGMKNWPMQRRVLLSKVAWTPSPPCCPLFWNVALQRGHKVRLSWSDSSTSTKKTGKHFPADFVDLILAKECYIPKQ